MSQDDNKTNDDGSLTPDELDGVAGGGLVEPIVSRNEPLTKLNKAKLSLGKDDIVISGTIFPRGGD